MDTKPVVKVVFELTDEVVMNGRKQVAFAYLGSRHPEKTEVWLPDDGTPYKPGHYVATECFLSREQYPRLVIGTGNLQPLTKGA